MEAKAVKYASTRFGIVKRSKGQSAIDHASYISRRVIVSEYDGQTFRLAFVEVIRHNRKMFEAEQERRDRTGERGRQTEQEQQKQKRRRNSMEL